MYFEVEAALREAGRGLEWLGVENVEAARLAGVLLIVQVDLLACARRVEHAAVGRPELTRSARLIFHAAHRLRGDRLAAAA